MMVVGKDFVFEVFKARADLKTSETTLNHPSHIGTPNTMNAIEYR